MNSICEMQTQQKRQFQILNNNIRCFGGRIEGSFVRKGNSNCRERVLTMDQVDEVNTEPLGAVNNANLCHCLVILQHFGESTSMGCMG